MQLKFEATQSSPVRRRPQTSWLRSLVAALLVIAATAPPPAYSGEADRAKLTAISARMNEFIAKREIAGAVTLVATREKVVHLEAAGQADATEAQAMRPDAIFWIASMTKPITATAVLMLQDAGKLSIDDLVGKHIPALSALKTPSGVVANLTIRHLLTHTSGLAEATPEQSKAAKLWPVIARPATAFEPDSKWQYSQSSINTAGRIIEVVSGQSYTEFLQKRLFTPLGMKDTTFYLAQEQMPRLAKSYKSEGNKLQESAIMLLHGAAPTHRDRYPAANGGLFSTAPDYARFCRMILNQGTLDNQRYLKPESVKLMTSVQTGELKTGFTEGNGWGLGWCVVRQPQAVTAMLSPGTFGHGGAYGTQAWIDPQKGLVYILMVQRSNFPNSDNSDVRRVFQETAAAALAK
ncbi:MAG: serine hydrolase domain-containing protein [Pyrinomonadaceae bacterium]